VHEQHTAAELTRRSRRSWSQLAKAVEEQRASDEFKEFWICKQIQPFSWAIAGLIAMAKPDATMVAGFSQWKRMGRSIKPGEKAIRSWRHAGPKRESETGDEEERVFFKSAAVFDVSQTSGRELAQFDVPEVQGQAYELLYKLEQVAAGRASMWLQELRRGTMAAAHGGT